MSDNNMYVGLDVHKDSLDISLADGERGAKVRFYGTIGGDLADLDKAIRKLRIALKNYFLTEKEIGGTNENGFHIHIHLSHR
jgi:hypothetical protein